MPVYCKKCRSCGHAFDQFAKMSESDSIVCPECKGATETDHARQGVPGTGNHVLYASWETEAMRMEYRFKPAEVLKARRTFGGRAAECIRDDGSVIPPDTASAKEFINAWHDRYEAKVAKEEAAGL